MSAIVKIAIRNVCAIFDRMVFDLHCCSDGVKAFRADTLSYRCRRAAKHPSRPVTAIIEAIRPDPGRPAAIAVTRRPSADIAPDGGIKRDAAANDILSRLDAAGAWTVNIEQPVIRLC